VKGNCGFFDFPRLAELSHAAEDALADVRAGRREPDSALVSAVLAIIDRIAQMVDAIEAGDAFAEGGDAELITALDISEEHSEPVAQEPAAQVALVAEMRSDGDRKSQGEFGKRPGSMKPMIVGVMLQDTSGEGGNSGRLGLHERRSILPAALGALRQHVEPIGYGEACQEIRIVISGEHKSMSVGEIVHWFFRLLSGRAFARGGNAMRRALSAVASDAKSETMTKCLLQNNYRSLRSDLAASLLP